MRARYLSILTLSAIVALALPALAQDDSINKGTGVEHGAREMYHGTKAELKDAAITARVKADLLSDKETGHYSIHVDTHGKGIVELSGDVPSSEVAEHAVQVAENVTGVRMVRNELNVREDRE